MSGWMVALGVVSLVVALGGTSFFIDRRRAGPAVACLLIGICGYCYAITHVDEPKPDPCAAADAGEQER
jgi:hypothetical protein